MGRVCGSGVMVGGRDVKIVTTMELLSAPNVVQALDTKNQTWHWNDYERI